MEATVVRGGKFTFTIGALQLSKGLRPSKRKPRNSDFLTTCQGAIGRDGVLSALDKLDSYVGFGEQFLLTEDEKILQTEDGYSIYTSGILGQFPYPQIFVLPSLTIVCVADTIYEVINGEIISVLGDIPTGSTWTTLSYFEYIYLTNGVVAVVRDPISKQYSISTTLPAAEGACDFNGQAILGSPSF